MSPYQFWAVLIAAAGWFLLGNLVAQRARIGSTGRIEMPTCYITNPGTDIPGVEWKRTDRAPYPLWFIVVLGVLSFVPLITMNTTWNWVVLIVLIVVTLLLLFAWMIIVPDRNALYYVESSREPAGDNQFNISYRLRSSSPTRRDFIILIVIAVIWMLIFLGIADVIANDMIRTGVLFAGFVMMVVIMYVLEKREQGNRTGVLKDYDYCKRCGGKLQSRTETRKIRENAHQSGQYVYYTERSEPVVIKTCKICGMVTEL